MIGGNIPGKTKVLSVAIFDYVEMGEWRSAHILAAGMIIFSFCVVLLMNSLEKYFRRQI
jgi:molybdate transport system permease protein